MTRVHTWEGVLFWFLKLCRVIVAFLMSREGRLHKQEPPSQQPTHHTAQQIVRRRSVRERVTRYNTTSPPVDDR
eukprot:scaffold898_cov200-Alexandrium_tamarense.AAC.3